MGLSLSILLAISSGVAVSSFMNSMQYSMLADGFRKCTEENWRWNLPSAFFSVLGFSAFSLSVGAAWILGYHKRGLSNNQVLEIMGFSGTFAAGLIVPEMIKRAVRKRKQVVAVAVSDAAVESQEVPEVQGFLA